MLNLAIGKCNRECYELSDKAGGCYTAVEKLQCDRLGKGLKERKVRRYNTSVNEVVAGARVDQCP